MTKVHKAGFVNIVGNPNVGKSTLMNQLVGERISIATFKAQTTRHRIMGIVNTPDMQIVFSDTPGVLKPNYKLQESMLAFSESALQDADILLYVTDVVENPEKNMDFLEKVQKMQIPVILLINKIDELKTLKTLPRPLPMREGSNYSASKEVMQGSVKEDVQGSSKEGVHGSSKEGVQGSAKGKGVQGIYSPPSQGGAGGESVLLADIVDRWHTLLPNAEILPISAKNKFGVDMLLKRIQQLLPESPAFFDKDQLTDKPARFFVSEIIREKILLYYDKEIPYSVEVVVERFKEDDRQIHINAVIYVERDSQKGIIIGHQGPEEGQHRGPQNPRKVLRQAYLPRDLRQGRQGLALVKEGTR